VRATWQIANLTTRDLYGQDPALQNRNTVKQMPGKETEGWLGEVPGGVNPSWGPRSGPGASEGTAPFTCRDANK
jgi:hypothetical protein